MCGISGILRPKGLLERDFKYSSLSLENLKFRGPDNKNSIKVNEKLILNHTRLSIIDPDKKNNQPLNSYSGRFVLVYDGEIYNFQELKNNLLDNCKNNTYFKKIEESFSDTRILIEHFEQFGIEQTLILLNGMYALAIYDRKSKFFYLARDYYGQKPLYYSNESHILSFSSLLTDCVELSGIEKRINKLNAQHGIQFGMSLLPESLISGIFELPPGHLMIACSHGETSLVKSFRDMKSKIKLNFINKNKSKKFPQILEEVIGRHLVADCDVGLLLSGGIDSSLIASCLSEKYSHKKINSFTLDFPSSNDSKYSSYVASKFDLEHFSFSLDEKIYSDIIQNTFYEIDIPPYDPAIFSARFLCRISKDYKIKVLLNGDGADEIFGGYRRYYKKYFFNSYLPKFIFYFLNDISQLINEKVKLSRKFNQINHLFLSNSAAESYINILSDNPEFYNNSDYIKLLVQDLYGKLSTPKLNALIDERFFLPNKMLLKTDRASMLENLEARSPYLDLAFLGLENKIDNKIPKKLLKDELKRKIENYPFFNKKEGFRSNFTFLENFLNEKKFLNKVNEINHLIGLRNDYKNNINKGKIDFNSKNPNSSWNYWALAKWLELNFLN